jgi:hypothetical protein
MSDAPFLSASTRRWIYSITLAVVVLLTGYRKLDSDAAEDWVDLLTAIFAIAPAVALKNITPDPPSEEASDAP